MRLKKCLQIEKEYFVSKLQKTKEVNSQRGLVFTPVLNTAQQSSCRQKRVKSIVS